MLPGQESPFSAVPRLSHRSGGSVARRDHSGDFESVRCGVLPRSIAVISAV